MPDDIPLPSRDIAFELLKILKVPYKVRRHSFKVSEKSEFNQIGFKTFFTDD